MDPHPTLYLECDNCHTLPMSIEGYTCICMCVYLHLYVCYVLLVFVALVVIVVIGENVKDVWVGGVGCVLLLVLLLWPRIIGVCSVSGEVVYWDMGEWVRLSVCWCS